MIVHTLVIGTRFSKQKSNLRHFKILILPIIKIKNKLKSVKTYFLISIEIKLIYYRSRVEQTAMCKIQKCLKEHTQKENLTPV